MFFVDPLAIDRQLEQWTSYFSTALNTEMYSGAW